MALSEETPPTVNDLGTPVVNGPTKLTPVWERAWTTDEMRKHCDKWSLAGDSALLHFLQDFSHKVISKTHEIEQLVINLDQETKVTNARVNNTINDFHMLSSTQFVESRVYDEDVQDQGQISKKIEQKTKEQKEAEIVSKISQALEIGLSVMDQAFERVEIQQDSDSEDDNALQTEVILEPKDPYIHRPLPYLIGSEIFHRDEFVGLGDMLSEEEEKIEKDTESEISTESESEEYEYDAAPKAPKEKHHMDVRKNSGNESDSSDLFPEGDRDEYYSRSSSLSSNFEANKNENMNDDRAMDVTDAQPPKLLAEQIDAQLRQHVRKNVSRKDTRRSSHSSVRSKTSIKIKEEKTDLKKVSSDEDLFGSLPVEEEDSLFVRKGGLFSGGGKLFDDDAKEGGLFDSIKEDLAKDNENEKNNLIAPSPTGRTLSGKKIPTGGVAILGKDSDLFTTEIIRKKSVGNAEDDDAENDKHKKAATPNKTPQSQPKTKGIFDDSDEDDLFSSSRKSTVSSVKDAKDSMPSRKNTLFASDEEDGLFSKSEKKAPEAKKPIGGVSLFGGLGGEVNAKIRAQRPPSDSESDENSDVLSRTGSRGSSSSKSSLHVSKTKTGIKDSRSNSFSSNSLFIEDPDVDDIFSTTNISKNSKQEVKIVEKDNLFGNDSEDLFTTSKSSEKIPKSSGVSKNVDSLFSNFEAEDDLFKVVSKPVVKKSSGSISLYPDESVNDKKNVSTESQSAKEKIVDVSKAPPPIRRVVSLFDEDDGDDLFSTSVPIIKDASTGSVPVLTLDEVDGPALKTVEKSSDREVTSIKKNLFDDDEFLFGDVATENPEVDLFTSTREQAFEAKSPAKEKKTSNSLAGKHSTISTVRKPVGGVALFGGVDLFGQKFQEKATEENNNIVEKIDDENVTEAQIKMQRRTPKLVDTRELSLSFDEPVDTSNTLASACKDRVRIQGRRRPPTRKNKQSALKNPSEKQNAPPQRGPPADESFPTEVEEEPQKSYVAKEPLDITSPSTEEEDLFSVDEPIKMHSETDLFAFRDAKTPSSRTKERDSKTRTDNIFSLPTSTHDGTAKDDGEFFADASSTSRKLSANVFEEIEDNIFAGSHITTVRESVKHDVEAKNDLETAKPTPKKSLDIFDDIEDDIFTSLPSKTKESKMKHIDTTSSLFGDAGDDDIFKPKAAIKVHPTVKRKDSATKKVPTKIVDAFDDPLLSTQKEMGD